MELGTKSSASAYAPAKINVHLSVGERRADGFHSLLSIFQMIDLADFITIELTRASQFSVMVDMGVFEPFSSNTMARAAQVFAKNHGLQANVGINCIKKIPMEAGLGGGSSDAATVLLLLNTLCGTPFSAQELRDMGAQVGSDVPFFLGDSAAACVEGRGEILTGIHSRSDLFGLVVMPVDTGISTTYAFSELDAARAQGLQSYASPEKEALIRMYSESPGAWHFHNDFRAVMGSLASLYDTLDSLVASEPGLFGTISGSGAAYCVLAEEDTVLSRFRTKMKKIEANVTIYDIKCLHRAHSGVTVSL